MEILGCNLSFLRYKDISFYLSIRFFELFKYKGEYYWDPIEIDHFCSKKDTTYDFLQHKQECLNVLKSIEPSVYLLDFKLVNLAIPFHQAHLDSQVGNSDLDSYVDSFFNRIERVTSGHNCPN